MKKTKKFLLATSGATVDGRDVKAEWLTGLASSYDPKTYGGRLNIEHIKGFSGDGPFRAYGDVLELSTEDVTVNFNGTDEVRTGLYGIFEVTEDAELLNKAGQKVYPSIEIEPNFAGKGFPYLMGVALTDTPACIGTERMEFNRQTPGTLSFSAADMSIAAAALEFAAAAPTEAASGEVKNFMDKASAFFDKFTTQNLAQKPEPKTEPNTEQNTEQNPAATPQANDVNAQFAEIGSTMMAGFKAFSDQMAATTAAQTAAMEKIGSELNTFKKDMESSESQFGTKRPASAGGALQSFDC